MMNPRAAKRYATAFFELSREQNNLKRSHADLKGILNLLTKSRDFTNFAQSPVIPTLIKRDILEKLFKKKCQPITLDFLKFLSERKNLGLFEEIYQNFETLFLEDRGILRGELESAHIMTKSQIQSFCSKLKHYYNKSIEVDVSVNKKMLGGFKTQIGDRIYDFSIRTKLENYRQAVLQA